MGRWGFGLAIGTISMPNVSVLRSGISCDRKASMAAFKTACYRVAQSLNVQVGEFRSTDGLPNFYYAEIVVGQDAIAVLCNMAFPVIGFSSPFEIGLLPGQYLLHFDLASAFVAEGFECPDASLLEAPVSRDDLLALRPEERKDVAYWRPHRIGDVIFNYFD